MCLIKNAIQTKLKQYRYF